MTIRPNVAVIIVAAGESCRMDGMDKIFAPLGGLPILVRVIDVFQQCEPVKQIVVVLREPNLKWGQKLVGGQGWLKAVGFCAGGARRQDSVLAGLDCVEDCEWVVIHDGARPLVTLDLINRGLETAGETGVAVAAVPVTDTIKIAGDDRLVRQTPPRSGLWAAQTPQVFRFDIIKEAYHQITDEVTDDASLVERLGYKVKLYMGAYDNIKITSPADLALAGILWSEQGA